MRYDHDNYELDGRPRIFLDGVEQRDTPPILWADDMTGEIAFVDVNHPAARVAENGQVIFNGLKCDRDADGQMVLPKVIKKGRVVFVPR